MAGDSPLLYLGAAADTSRLMSFESVRKDVNTELQKAMARSTRILRRHRRAVDLIAEALLRDGRIEGSEVERIVGT
ncbi:hypothetical protein CO683_37585 [Bradyrhizobium ottawaense]|uniref:hypothetical protein n=1 Tax=Bradyrhizobium ottawaense TaxID=931866 RepID=UPI000BE9A8B3|nr:hypothetical protein [Bradyrhizobium ottawaense]PDT64519.1 hypothetical protein CO683_37585 [Bradyrhizobium ottawaense]